ncbi:MAG: CHAT domain-containing tetratricopeptide repeat protein [Chitinophagales bacterium]
MKHSNFKLHKANILQQKGLELIDKFDFRVALPILEDASELYRTHNQWYEYALCQNKVADCLIHLGQFEAAIELLQNNLQIEVTDQEVGYDNLAYTYKGLSTSYAHKGEVDKAFGFINKVLSLCQKHDAIPKYFLHTAYNTIGWLYSIKQDYGQAIFYFQKNLPYYLKSEDKIQLVGTYNNLAFNHKMLKNSEKAIEYYLKAIELHDPKTFDKASVSIVINANLGDCYANIGNQTKALKAYQKAYQNSHAIFGESHFSTGRTAFAMGNFFKGNGHPKKALAYYKKSFSVYKKIQNYDVYNTAISLQFIAACLEDMDRWEEALPYHQKAIAYLIGKKNWIDPYQKMELFVEYLPPRVTLFLVKKSKNLLVQFYRNRKEIDLFFAFETIELATRLIQEIRKTYKADESKFHLASEARNVHALLLQILTQIRLLLQDKTFAKSDKNSLEELAKIDIMENAFTTFEQDKSVLLLSNLKNQAAKITANIPDDLLKQEQQTNRQMTALSQKISRLQAQEAKVESEELIELQQEYANHKLQYDQLVQQLETNYPQYYQLKHQAETVTIKTLQQKLLSRTALVEYFIGDKHLYLFAITSNDTQFIQLEKPTDFEDLVEAYKASIDEIDKSEYCELAFELYQLLIKPLTSTNQLITSNQAPITNFKIIPSGILSTIPFEALLTEEVTTNAKYADLPYLLLQYNISYHYSATLWSQNIERFSTHSGKNEQTESSFIGFAPVYKREQNQPLEKIIKRGIYNEETTRSIRIGEETFSELIYSEEEVTSIQSYFNAKNIPAETYLHQAANIYNFLQNIGKHKYILISAHGFYNEKQPDLTGIILSPDDNQTFANPSDVAKSSPIRAENSPSFEKHGDVWSDKGGNIFYLSDAYNLQLNADLVVLSCCETGVGKLAKGEGVMALNRGFFYAGAKNVIYTLFKVYDQASCQLTKHLFQHILEEKPYAFSLKEAKRQLILQGKAPIHWAGYLLIGE